MYQARGSGCVVREAEKPACGKSDVTQRLKTRWNRQKLVSASAAAGPATFWRRHKNPPLRKHQGTVEEV